MSVWDTYGERLDVNGKTKRSATLKREVRRLNTKLPESLSYHTVTIFDSEHGYNITSEEMTRAAIEQNVAIINSDNLDEKYIYSMPGEDIEQGSLVYWMDNYWLVNERDANTTVYTRAKLLQCNYLLRWVSDEDKICEQWCVVEDGTKYLTGLFEDRNFVVERGDSRIAVTIARTSETIKLNRTNRFLIDDPESSTLLAYTLSKPLKLGGSFNNKGVYKFVLQEVNSTINDNHELRIADYYKHFPKETTGDITSDTGRKVWL